MKKDKVITFNPQHNGGRKRDICNTFNDKLKKIICNYVRLYGFS